MQGNRPRTREEPRVRSLTRAAETREGETPDCWHWGLREVPELLFLTLPILIIYITRSYLMLKI